MNAERHTHEIEINYLYSAIQEGPMQITYGDQTRTWPMPGTRRGKFRVATITSEYRPNWWRRRRTQAELVELRSAILAEIVSTHDRNSIQAGEDATLPQSLQDEAIGLLRLVGIDPGSAWD